MVLDRRSFPPIILDNEDAYFNLLEAILNSVDEYCEGEVSTCIGGYIVRISPSHPQYLNSLLQSIKQINTTLGIQVEFSKSMKATSTIAFILNNQK